MSAKCIDKLFKSTVSGVLKKTREKMLVVNILTDLRPALNLFCFLIAETALYN